MVVACVQPNPEDASLLPRSSSEVDEVILVMDEGEFDSDVGDYMLSILQEEYPLLPQPEPRFNIARINQLSFNPLLKRASTIIYVGCLGKGGDTAKEIQKHLKQIDKTEKEFFYFIRKNVWANPQQVIYFFGQTEEELLANLQANKEGIINLIYSIEDRKAYRNAFASGVSQARSEKLKETFGVDLEVPVSFKEIVIEDDVHWYREDQKGVISNLYLQKIPYSDDLRMDGQSVQKIRKAFGKQYVKSQVEGAFMTTEEKAFTPSHEKIDVNGRPAIQGRGLWTMENDFMGGPYINYLINDKANKQYLFVEGFVFAPGEKKRKLIRRLEQWMLSIK